VERSGGNGGNGGDRGNGDGQALASAYVLRPPVFQSASRSGAEARTELTGN
jgi:hypothetical protein